jgi:hypothetical protein
VDRAGDRHAHVPHSGQCLQHHAVSISEIVAFGVLFTIIIGGIDLSVGSVVALVGIVSAQLLKADFAIPRRSLLGDGDRRIADCRRCISR